MSGDQSIVRVLPLANKVAAQGHIRWESGNDFIIEGDAAICLVRINAGGGVDPQLESVQRVGLRVRDDLDKVRGVVGNFAIPLRPSLGLRRGDIEKAVVAISAFVSSPNDGSAGLDEPCVVLDSNRKPNSVLAFISLIDAKPLAERHRIRAGRPLTWSPQISMGTYLHEDGFGLVDPNISADGSAHELAAFIPVDGALPFGWGDIDEHHNPPARLWNLNLRRFGIDGTPEFEIERDRHWK